LKGHYSGSDLCHWLDCPRSSYYWQPKSSDASQLVETVERILLRFPFYGYRKVHKELLRQRYVVGEHVVRRVLSQLGLTRSVGKVRIQTTDSHHAHGSRDWN
jgi:hypothetical protein